MSKELRARSTLYEHPERRGAVPDQPTADRSRAAQPAPVPRTPRGEVALSAREREELDQLRREVKELRHANEVLKAASAIFAADLRTNSQVVYNVPDRQDRLA